MIGMMHGDKNESIPAVNTVDANKISFIEAPLFCLTKHYHILSFSPNQMHSKTLLYKAFVV
jgi:hypothetical protein